MAAAGAAPGGADDKAEGGSKPARDKAAFMARARARFKRAKEYWNTIYTECKNDLRFYGGDQWPADIKMARETPGGGARPCLTINRLPQFHNQIVNEYRQSTIGMKAAPQGDEDVEVGRVYHGLFRQIEKASHAQIAYVKSLSDATIHGIGFFRIITDYASDASFDQDIFIRRFVNPFCNYPDPDAEGFFLEDSQFWFIIDKITEDSDEYEEYYGGDDPEFDADDFPADDTKADWRDGKEIIVAEYFYFEREKKELYLLDDGSTIFADEVDEEHAETILQHIVKRRFVQAKVLKWAKIDGVNILEEREWAKPRIPVVPVWGTELWIEDERIAKGITRDAMDSCRMNNYWESAKTEMIALAPKAPYIAAKGQLEGVEADWQAATHTPKAVLYYNAISVDGHLVGAPQRQVYEAPVQAIIQASGKAVDDIKATIGLYDASLGARGNEVSGKAINARKQEGDTATYNYVDNLALSIGYAAQIIGELIPAIYDTKRRLRIIGEDDTIKNIEVNGADGPNIVDVNYDLVLDTGPSYATKREQTAQSIIELSHNNPKVMDLAGDIAIANMDFAGAQEIARRLKRALPPEVVGDEDDIAAQFGALKQQMAQVQQLVEALQTELDEKDKELVEAKLAVKNKAGELKLKARELDLKKIEVLAKVQQADTAAEHGADAGSLAAEAVEGVGELRGMVEQLMDMLLAAIPAEDAEPAPVEAEPELPGLEEPAPVE